ncbi:MAG: phospholipase [Pseudomonas sp.]|nr:phospholipase [Pseudomonas sp.]
MKMWCALLILLWVSAVQAQEVVHSDLPLAYLEQTQADAKNRPLVIFLHGHGGNEHALFGLKDALPANYTYLSVRAPITLKEGVFEWFDKTNRSGEYDGDAAQVSRSEQLIADFITAAVRKYRTSNDKVYLVGFSQGAMMSYYLALHHPQALGGIAVLSGTMLPALRAEVEPGKPLGLPVMFIAHGTDDATLPLALARQADQLLKGASVTVQFHVYPGLEHAMNQAEITDLRHWLEQVNRRI